MPIENLFGKSGEVEIQTDRLFGNAPSDKSIGALFDKSDSVPDIEPQLRPEDHLGVLEAAANLATGAVGFTVGTVSQPFIQLALEIQRDPDPAGKSIEMGNFIAEHYTYQPKTETGKTISEIAMSPIEVADKGLRAGLEKSGLEKKYVDMVMQPIYALMAATGLRGAMPKGPKELPKAKTEAPKTKEQTIKEVSKENPEGKTEGKVQKDYAEKNFPLEPEVTKDYSGVEDRRKQGAKARELFDEYKNAPTEQKADAYQKYLDATKIKTEPTIIEKDSPEKKTVTSYLKDFKERVRKRMTVDSTPEGDTFKVGDEMAAHAAVSQHVPRLLADKVAETFPKRYKNQKFLNEFERMRVMDNVIDGYATAVKESEAAKTQVRQLQEEVKNIQAEIDALGSAGMNLFQRADIIKKLKDKEVAKVVELKNQHRTWKQRFEDAKAIGDAHDIKDYTNKVTKLMQRSDIKEAIKQWNSEKGLGTYLESLWRTVKKIDEAAPEDPRGHFTGLRANLVHSANIETLSGHTVGKGRTKPGTGPSYENPNIKRDKFDRRAKFTAEYSTNFQHNLETVLKDRLNNVTKIALYDKMIETKTFVPSSEGMPSEIKGQRPVPFSFDYPVGYEEVLPNGTVVHRTQLIKKSGWIPEKLERELRDALNTDMKIKPNLFGSALTTIQLTQVADAVTHTSNLLKEAARSQGLTERMSTELVRKIPYVGKADAIKRINDVYKEVLEDSPSIRKEMAELSQYSLLRSGAHLGEALSDLAKKTQNETLKKGAEKLEVVTNASANFLFKVDTATRILMYRGFKQMKKDGRIEGTTTELRHLIEQVGQYNDRLMGPVQRAFRNSGLGSFVVAGNTMNRNAYRSFTGYSGIPGATAEAGTKTRAINLAAPFMAATIPMLINYYFHGDVFGPEGNAPLGHIVMPGAPDEAGKRMMLNVFQDSHFQRFLRISGLAGIEEGLISGKDSDQYLLDSFNQATSGFAHPYAGPFPTTVFKAITGYDPLSGVPLKRASFRIPEGGTAQIKENVRGAAKELNPLAYSVADEEFEKKGAIAKALSDTPLGDFSGLGHSIDVAGKSVKSATGIKNIAPPTDAAETMARNFSFAKLGDMTKEGKEQAIWRREMLNKLRDDFEATDEELSSFVDSGQIPKSLVKKLEKRSEQSRLMVWLTGNTADQTMRVYWKIKDPALKEEVADLIHRKMKRIKNSMGYSKAELLEERAESVYEDAFGY